MAYTYGQFWNEVYNSLERDQRFQSLVDVACNRATDEILIRSNFGNFKYETQSESGRGEYNLPEGTMYVNNVTFDSVPMDRITFKEHLDRQAMLQGGIIYSSRPGGFLIKDNRDLILSPTPRVSSKTIAVYLTIKTADLTFADNEDTDFPVARVYSKGAFHFARHYLYLADNREKDARTEYEYFERETAEANRRLNGSVSTKVTRKV